MASDRVRPLFVTEDLLEQRKRQREALAGIPDFLLGDHEPVRRERASGHIEAPNQPHRLERRLRDEADSLRDSASELDGFLPRAAKAVAAQEAMEWTKQVVENETPRERRPGFEVPLAIADRLDRESMDAHVSAAPRDVDPHLREYITLLVWADRLAEDGYTDPRLTSQE